jgi:hypothetical protein
MQDAHRDGMRDCSLRDGFESGSGTSDVDDGRDDIDWIPPRPNAFWAVDTHLGPES